MLTPGRHGSDESYRYGFQGQEKDDELKGEGNSHNYKYRMHDPRLGRFFARDPLAPKYPWYTPYQFSGNKVIHMVELEGLEETGFTRMLDRKYGSMEYIKMTSAEHIQEAKDMQLFGGIIAVVAIDVFITKGEMSKFLIKQYGAQVGVNAAVEGITWAVTLGEHQFDPMSIIKDSFIGFDFADAGIDTGIKLLAKKYNIGKIQKALEIVAPSLFDITIENNIQVIAWNKDAGTVITDIVGNYLTGEIEGAIEGTKIEMPTIKLSAAKESEIIGQFIMEQIENVIIGQLINTPKEDEEVKENFFTRWISKKIEKIKDVMSGEED